MRWPSPEHPFSEPGAPAHEPIHRPHRRRARHPRDHVQPPRPCHDACGRAHHRNPECLWPAQRQHVCPVWRPVRHGLRPGQRRREPRARRGSASAA
ncbi:MAG: hypothetical protein E2587_27720 [Delftia sp.]|nr:hypothetical protein [Delftia sp.]